MPTQTLISRKRLHFDKCYDSTHSTFTQSSSEPWQGKSVDPSVYHFEAEDDSGKVYWFSGCCLAISISLCASMRVHCGLLQGLPVPMLLSAPADGEELPDVPYVFLADMGPFGNNKKMRIYGGEMDVCKTGDGVKALRYWKADPAEIALYESGCHSQALSMRPATEGSSEISCKVLA